MANFVQGLRIDGPEVMADSNLANLDPTHLDEMVTPALVQDLRNLNGALGAWKIEMEERIAQAAGIDRAGAVLKTVDDMVTTRVQDLTEMWEARISMMSYEAAELKEKIRKLEEKDKESYPSASGDQKRNNERMDLKMIEGIPNWNGPHQQLFLEWAWGGPCEPQCSEAWPGQGRQMGMQSRYPGDSNCRPRSRRFPERFIVRRGL